MTQNVWLKPFNSFPPQICFQEVPDQVSLAFSVTGCPLRCSGCHSQDSWDPKVGEALTPARFRVYLSRYQHLIDCVLFFGGEWHPDALQTLLDIAHQQGLKTCLYTGMDKVPARLTRRLDYLKTGRWLANRGGLSSPNTNQRFMELASGNLLNFRFMERDHAAA
ncbi:anaerobic ribonucleoside-triphosphate reductase activating protein [Bowmanella sp. Y26]|uniref:anaerobic ribonucleoside-triphosphate reductase activating protein n=1 Tax=Bowmanella yangjiangensis TaxID=2811230 RepID=UPI001BDBC9B1|nr:anaerobic ribonucleoside-triphosphate reductase activating protein [Bowmanella yangjiangensis]MBT1063411.1 anaerobic ribonucleoside-triphosphate reductase activating protein [Bowmanella yangjiangensis]